MSEKSKELIEGLIQSEIIELGLLAKDHRNELQEWFYRRIREYAQAQKELELLWAEGRSKGETKGVKNKNENCYFR